MGAPQVGELRESARFGEKLTEHSGEGGVGVAPVLGRRDPDVVRKFLDLPAEVKHLGHRVDEVHHEAFDRFAILL